MIQISCNQDPVIPSNPLTPTVELIGSQEVELLDVGDGTRTFVFIHDIGGELDEWIRSNIAEELAATNQVIAYNRPGYGESDANERVPSLRKLADELDMLIQLKAKQNQVIIIGHAWGATLARVYAVNYPEKVAGMLMLDAIHEGQYEEDEERILPFWYYDNISEASQHEIDAFTANIELLDTLGGLPDKPLTLITAYGPVITLEKRFAAQASLLEGISPGAVRHFTLDQIGYQIHLESPNTVIQELFSLSQRIR